MVEFIVLPLLAAYVAGIFPAAVWAVRQSAEAGHCHQESRPGRVADHHWRQVSNCRSFHHAQCWRPSERVEYGDLKAAPLALIWPALAIGVAVLRQANKKPSRRMLEAQIARLERENGMAD